MHCDARAAIYPRDAADSIPRSAGPWVAGSVQGPVFEDAPHLARVCDYIPLHPVRAGVVTADRVGEALIFDPMKELLDRILNPKESEAAPSILKGSRSRVAWVSRGYQVNERPPSRLDEDVGRTDIISKAKVPSSAAWAPRPPCLARARTQIVWSGSMRVRVAYPGRVGQLHGRTRRSRGSGQGSAHTAVVRPVKRLAQDGVQAGGVHGGWRTTTV